MKANYHTHTVRCGHASGAEREYIEQAIRGGLSILGFSDHVPVPYETNPDNGVRMLMGQMEDYVDTILRLREEYRSDIEIRLGFEVEYFPSWIEEQLRAMEPYPIEYFLLGQHYLGDGWNSPYSGRPTSDDRLLEMYVSQTEEALKTGLFSCFAHPDLFFYVGDDTFYRQQMRRLCLTARDLSIPLEINLLGLMTHRNYPNPLFWEVAGDVGNTVILGSDAHQPQNTCREDSLQAGLELARRYGLPVVDTLELKKPALS